MEATSGGPWYEVQGQADDGTWHGIYHIDERGRARRTFAMVVDSTDPMYDRWQDVRLVAPSERALRRRERHKGEIWSTA